MRSLVPLCFRETYFFAFQIYCDFSAYSDIAIGSARLLGYDLSKNFDLPYFAISITDFWRRWHISLTTWFTTYVYIPLGGNRVDTMYWGRNVVVVFLLSGLWHGASWTFLIWGALHAGYYMVQRVWGHLVPLAAASVTRQLFAMLVTFHAVVLAWVFFRATTVEDAFLIAARIFADPFGFPDMGSSRFSMAINIGLVLFLISVQFCQARGWFSIYFSNSVVPAPLRAIGYALLLCAIALFGASSSAFIYFQF